MHSSAGGSRKRQRIRLKKQKKRATNRTQERVQCLFSCILRRFMPFRQLFVNAQRNAMDFQSPPKIHPRNCIASHSTKKSCALRCACVCVCLRCVGSAKFAIKRTLSASGHHILWHSIAILHKLERRPKENEQMTKFFIKNSAAIPVARLRQPNGKCMAQTAPTYTAALR